MLFALGLRRLHRFGICHRIDCCRPGEIFGHDDDRERCVIKTRVSDRLIDPSQRCRCAIDDGEYVLDRYVLAHDRIMVPNDRPRTP